MIAQFISKMSKLYDGIALNVLDMNTIVIYIFQYIYYIVVAS